jgi:hypothetical protein
MQEHISDWITGTYHRLDSPSHLIISLALSPLLMILSSLATAPNLRFPLLSDRYI